VWSKATEVVGLILSALGLGSIALVGIEYLFHVAIFYNPTRELVAQYDTEVKPLLLLADQSTPEIQRAVANNDNAAFKAATRDFVVKQKLQSRITQAIEVAESIIKCHKSYICLFDGYDDYEYPLLRFWYAYVPAVEEMREDHTVNASFGKTLQAEAARILRDERRRGLEPTP